MDAMFQDQFCCSFVCILSVIDWFFGCTASKIEKKRIFFVIWLCGGKCMYSIKLNGNAFLPYGLICVEVIVVANIQSGLIWFCIFSHYIYLTVIFFSFFFLSVCNIAWGIYIHIRHGWLARFKGPDKTTPYFSGSSFHLVLQSPNAILVWRSNYPTFFAGW